MELFLTIATWIGVGVLGLFILTMLLVLVGMISVYLDAAKVERNSMSFYDGDLEDD